MNLFLITGGSKGLGRAFAEKVLSEGHFCVTISRTLDPSWKSKGLIQVRCDLSKDYKLTKKTLDGVFKKINLNSFQHLYLVNNAAQIEPVTKLGNFVTKDVNQHLYLNVNIPILLSNDLLQRNLKNKGYTVLAHISSGASSFAITNWSLYCASKAALEMFNSVLQIQTQSTKKLKSFTFSPGIIDTGMQNTIRNISKKNFPEVDRFKQYKKEKQLRSAAEVAEILFKTLKEPSQIKKSTYSI